jgi:tetratricopeptide (TPR) repeat protein
LGAQIAAGGMGLVFRAFDTLAQREVAYKRLVAGQDGARARMAALFEREYDALSRLAHPNIVQVYEYGFDAVGPYYTMELLTGQDLAALAPLPVREACKLLRDVASALALLHARRLLHRDVSAANVRSTADGRAKLLDFGALTRFGRQTEVVGTPPFVAPECLAGDSLDQRADLFALGALAYWTLTRRHAFHARSISQLPDVWQTPPVAPSALASDISKELDELVLSLLELDPLARPPTAAHVLDRITAIAELPAEPDERHVAYSYLAHPPLFGRTAVLQELDACVDATLQGQGSALLLEAAPGFGRTAVLEQLAVDVQLRGATVLRWQAGGSASLAQAVVRLALVLAPDTLGERDSSIAGLLGPQRLRADTPRTSLEASDRLGRVVDIVQRCALALSARLPLVVLADDIQNADAESLALLASLTHALPGHALSLVMSQREGSESVDANALRKLMAGARRIALGEISEQDTDELVQTVFGGAHNAHRLAAWLHQQSGGSPGQCMDLSRMLLARGDISYALGKFTLPHHVSQAIGQEQAEQLRLARLSPLSAEALALARLLSLHEAPLREAPLRKASGLSPEQAQHALEELAARGIIRIDHERAAFVSESLKGAVARSLPAEQTPRLHHALAEAILATSDGSADDKFAACDHLISAGQEWQATALVDRALHEQAFAYEMGRVPLFEKILDIYRKQGRSDAQCVPIFITLLSAGFLGDLATLRRHFEPGFRALSKATGMNVARRLRPWLGGKLALYVGLAWAALRHALTPRARRFGTFTDNLRALISASGSTAAAAISAFDPQTAFRAVSFLEPFGAMSKRAGPYMAREFCVATAELGAGQFGSASRRYEWLLEALSRPVLGLEDSARKKLRDGCLHGKAQAEVTSGSPRALTLADELQASDPFFAPHAEVIRMTYYGALGMQETADLHRGRGEVLALRGGASWTAFTMMAIRSAYCYMLTRDTLGLVRASEELDRLAAIAPNLLACRDAARAYAEVLRDHPQAAVQLYEQAFASYPMRELPTWKVDRALYAEALRGAGHYEQAKAVCMEVIETNTQSDQDTLVLVAGMEQLALTEAALGNYPRALALLDEIEPHMHASGSLLVIGSLHRDRAQIALQTRDAAAFDAHFEQMLAVYRPTKNPALIQQCRKLLAQAEASGLAVASRWEQSIPAPQLHDEQSNEAGPAQTALVLTRSERTMASE